MKKPKLYDYYFIEKQSLALDLRVPALQLRLTELRGKCALVEKHPDFSLCHLEESQSSIEQSATSLFPIVSVTFRYFNL